MRGLVIRWLSNGVALVLTSLVIKGIEVNNVFAVLMAAIVLGILNAFVRPLVLTLHLPVNNYLSLVLFALVVNAAMLIITSQTVNGFSVSGFLPITLGVLALNGFSFITNVLIGDRGNVITKIK